MEWWGWVAWTVSMVAALFGLYFGIRAEVRAGYRPLWVLGPRHEVVNRTGEDAAGVLVFVQSESGERMTYRAVSVGPDEAVSFDATPYAGNRQVFIVWFRPTTGRTYWWPRYARKQTQRIRQHQRGVIAQAKKQNKALPQLGVLSPEALRELRWWHWRP